jgi:hypothetical protein
MEGALGALSLAEEVFRILNSDYLDRTRKDLKRVRKSMA